MTRCGGRYRSFRQLLRLIWFMYVYLVLRIYFYITCYCCVTWLCIARLSLLTLLHRRSSLRDPAAQTADRGVQSAEPFFFNQVSSSLAGWRAHGMSWDLIFDMALRCKIWIRLELSLAKPWRRTRGLEIWLLPFLILTVGGGKCSNSRCGRSNALGKNPYYHWICGCVEPTASFGGCGEEKNLLPLFGFGICNFQPIC